jgi:hypothetical protein
MDITGLGSIFEFGGKLIDRLIPDPAQKLAAQQELMKMAMEKELAVMANDTKLLTAQTDINAVEAANPSIFVSGGRPAAMWVCVAGMGYQFVLLPLVTFAYQLYTGHALPVLPPMLDDNLWQLLTGLLGLAGWRSFDKKNGVASK